MNEFVLKNLIKNISTYRKNKGCSAKLLSELIGCESSYVSKVENGRIVPPINKLIAIANYFEIEFVELFK